VNVLIPNLGSTSVKYQILEMPSERVLAHGKIERVTNYRDAIEQIGAESMAIDAVVLKAAHAGPCYRGTFIIDEGVLGAMRQYRLAAALHNSIYLSAIEAFQQVLSNVPIVASFEPEFHATMPEHARRYGVPEEWRAEGVIRYGFHGASHQFIAERISALIAPPVKLVSCHLGGSSSVCSIDGGKSVDTTMGFSPQSGLENATRPGDLDIFAVLYMMERRGWTIDEVQRQLTQNGGLAGISGVDGGDIRDIEVAAAGGSRDAALALEVFAHQVKKAIGAGAAVLGGIDAVAFTGGIGENSAQMRAAACAGLAFLGIKLDAQRNKNGRGERVISDDDSLVSVWVVPTNEELVIARRAFRLLASSAVTR
jgi:acetate kinase